MAPLPRPVVPSTGARPTAMLAPRLLTALVDRWVRLDTPPDADPRLSVWTHDVHRAALVGAWSASARLTGRIDAWLRADLVRRLASGSRTGARADSPTDSGLVLVWERPGPPQVRAGDLAWYAAWRAAGDGAVGHRAGGDGAGGDGAGDPSPLVVVTRGGWVTVPDGTVGRRRRVRRAT